MGETPLQEHCPGRRDAGLPASPPISFQPGGEGGEPGSSPQRDPLCGTSSGVTQVHVLVLFLKTLSLGFLDDVPALVELVHRCAHNLQYTCTRTCTQACTHRVHTGTRPPDALASSRPGAPWLSQPWRRLRGSPRAQGELWRPLPAPTSQPSLIQVTWVHHLLA